MPPTAVELGPADRRRHGPVPVRQHQHRPDPRRHLLVRLHGPDRRRRGEAEPRRRGRPLDRPPARPADGQGLRDRRARARSSCRLHGRGVARGAADRLGSTLPSTTPSAIVMLVVWFVLGYTLYSTALGFLGALASRMEEASNASTPVTFIAMVAYFVAILVGAQRPDRDRRADRDLPAAVGADGRPAAGGARRDRAVGGRRLDASSPIAAIWALFTIGGARLRGCRPPDGRPDQAARRLAVGREVGRRRPGRRRPAWRPRPGRARSGRVERLEQARPAAGVPEQDALAVERARRGPARAARPAPSRCRSGRRGSPRVRARSRVASSAAPLGRP